MTDRFRDQDNLPADVPDGGPEVESSAGPAPERGAVDELNTVSESDTDAEASSGDAVGYYVSVVDGGRRRLLVGPFTTRARAEGQVETVRGWCTAHQPDAWFFGFGVARAVARPGARLPDGPLNDRIRDRIPDLRWDDEPRFSRVERARIRYAVQDWAGNYARIGDAARYLTEGHLEAVVAAHGYHAVHTAVHAELDRWSSPATTTAEDRAARATTREAAAQALGDDAAAAIAAGDHDRALSIVDDAEELAPDLQPWDRIRDTIRSTAEAARRAQR